MKKGIGAVTLVFTLVLAMGTNSSAAVNNSSGTARTDVVQLSATQSAFTDVRANDWYAEAVAYCLRNGLMAGTSETTFSPNTELSRAMIATILYRASNSPAVTGTSSFMDVKNGEWYSDAITWANQNGIISGYGNHIFGTYDPITREQLITILWRYKDSPAPTGTAAFADINNTSSFASSAVSWGGENDVVNVKAGNKFEPQVNATRAEAAFMFKQVTVIATEQIEETALVETQAGAVQGTVNDGIYTYLGVPYAEATERFVPAGEVKPWDGVRLADTYGPMSPQGAILGMEVNADETGTSNSSQNLNIWTPGTGEGQKRPVMVWLHGGGFATGTANDATTNGKNLSQSGDVVVVSVNHRLNVYGHLDLSSYGEKYKYSGNVGLTDIVTALEWIQDNIEAFGGDPGNVTVFGESGGGAKVLSLMTTPYAAGLFHKGIIESGATETMGVTFTTKEASEALTERILEILNITPNNIEEIQNVPNRELQEASSQALQETANEYKIPAAFTDDYAMEWGPVIDGDYMPTNPVTEDGFADAGKDIPLLIGSNLNEWTTFVPTIAHTNMTEEARNAYAQAYPNKDVSGAENVDTFIRLPMLKIMSHKVDQGGAPVYAYVFTWEDGTRGSYHGAEIPFVFNNVNGGDADTQKLAETVSQAWINFAKTGTPSAENLPVWEAYDRENGATMILDTESELVHNHDKKLMELLEPDYNY